MSSTNRGSKPRKTNKHDYYVTPVADIRLFLNKFLDIQAFRRNAVILDPCAGGDEKHEMSYPEALKPFLHPGDKLITLDIREDSKAEIITDYLTYVPNPQPDLIITNPPFYLARQVVEKAINDVVYGGWVIMLLRLNYFGSDKRKSFWGTNMPSYAFVHSKRISFTDDGKTDSIEYMHACWQKGARNTFTQLMII